MITEAELIEIAQRRRKLEDALSQANTKLAASEQYHDWEARNFSQGDSTFAKKQFEHHSLCSVDIADLRVRLKMRAEAGRDDMNRLCEEIRRSAETRG